MVGIEVIGAFLTAADAAVPVLGHGEVARRWAEPSALQGLTVGGVATHLYSALRRGEIALDEALPVDPAVVGLPEFYGLNRIDAPADLTTGIHLFLRDDANQRAEAGPNAIVEKYLALLGRLHERLPHEDLARLVPVVQVPNGVTALGTYLVTRVIEAVVHTDDLAVSAGVGPPSPPEEAVSVAIEAFTELARARSGDLAVVRAFARRERADPETLRVL